LKHQWKQELASFTDRSASVAEGPQSARAAAYAAESFYKITNYDVLHHDLNGIRRWAPDLVILDEAQPPMPAETAASQAAAAALQETAPEEDRSDIRQVPAPEGETERSGSLGTLLAAGASFLDQLSRFVASAHAAPPGQGGESALLASLFARDEGTGQAYLKLPLPSEAALKQIAGALGTLAQAFTQRP
jgi:hypothetical protein